MERVRAGFQKRRGVPYVSLCVDGSHIPYKPNSGEDEQAFMNYKQWTSLLCVGYINSLHLSVDMAECMTKHAQITAIFGAHNTCTEHAQRAEALRRAAHSTCSALSPPSPPRSAAPRITLAPRRVRRVRRDPPRRA